MLSSDGRANRPHLGLCPEANVPLQGRQGSRGCIPVHFTQNVRTEQAEALGGLADYAQGLLSDLSGRHPSRSIRIVSTESLLSRNSDSPSSEHVVRVKRNDSPFGRNDVSLAEELKCES